MIELAIKGAAYGREGIGKRKYLAADQQVVIFSSDRMPKHAFRRNRNLGNEICLC